jgi:hypothetical protein
MNTKNQTIKNLCQEIGHRQTAMYILDKLFERQFYMSIYDFPDSSELCNTLDEAEALFNNEEYLEGYNILMEFTQEVYTNFLQYI